MAAEAVGHFGVVAGQELGAVFFDGDGDVLFVAAHRAVVNDDGDGADAVAAGGLKIGAAHPYGGVAHQVDHGFFGGGQLGAQGVAEAGAQLRGVAPAEVAAGGGGFVERHNLVAGVAGVVGYDAVGLVQPIVQFPDHAVGADGYVVGGEAGQPLGQPFLLDAGDFGGDGVIAAASVVAEDAFDFPD